MTLLKAGDTGPQIKALQQTILQVNNRALPRFGADSDFGQETLDALARLLNNPEILKRGWVDNEDQQTLLTLRPSTVAHPGKWADVRSNANPLQRKALRGLGDFDIVWHQSDCEMGERLSRYRNSSAHFFVTSGGQIVQLHDVEWLTYHAHALNARSIGIEIEGAFLGIEGNTKTWAKYHAIKPQALTGEQIEAAMALARYLKDLLSSRGSRLRAYYAHRQGSNTRDRDPGSLIWQSIVLPSALETGCEVPFERVFGKGKPIPKQWDPRSTFDY
jgi:hypothetical protein